MNTPALRGLTGLSKSQPLGIYGESLDVLLANLDEAETVQLKAYSYMIDWLDKYIDRYTRYYEVKQLIN
ncbi:MAG: hypothetical protein IPN86_09605 [Saprospiraceae bacterium]|nr:hypothetical protein [Saprospiraceae bacterium]